MIHGYHKYTKIPIYKYTTTTKTQEEKDYPLP